MPIPTSGLVGRYVAGTGYTLASGRISQWDDQSGNGNHLTQGTAARQPLPVTDWRGRSAVRFELTNNFLTIPSTLAMDIRSMSVFVCGRARSSGGDKTVISITGSSTAIPLRHRVNGSVPECVSAGGYTSNTLNTLLNQEIHGATLSASATVAHTSLSSQSHGAPAAYSGNGGQLGALNSGTYFYGEMFEVLIYNRTLTSLEVAEIKAQWTTDYQIPAALDSRQILFEGDSIFTGFSSNFEAIGWQFAKKRPLWRVQSTASSGATISTLTSRAARIDAHYNAGFSRNVLVVHIGTNDMGSVGGFQSAATVYANLITYLTARKTAGWEVWATTRLATAGQAAVDEYNALLYGTPGGGTGPGIVADTGIAGLINYAADPRFDAGSHTDALYYQPDGLHPVDLGSDALADITNLAIPGAPVVGSPGSFFFAA